MSIHTNPDALAWAKFFEETRVKNGWPLIPDEATMHGWFANAMMAMHDHSNAALRTRLAESEGEVGRLTRESEGRFVAATMKAEALLKLEAERNIARQDEEAWRAACQVAEAEVGRLRDALEAVTECEEHRPCGLCRDRVRRAVEAKP